MLRGDEVGWAGVLDAARTRSLFAPRRAVVVRGADALAVDEGEGPAPKARKRGKDRGRPARAAGALPRRPRTPTWCWCSWPPRPTGRLSTWKLLAARGRRAPLPAPEGTRAARLRPGRAAAGGAAPGARRPRGADRPGRPGPAPAGERGREAEVLRRRQGPAPGGRGGGGGARPRPGPALLQAGRPALAAAPGPAAAAGPRAARRVLQRERPAWQRHRHRGQPAPRAAAAAGGPRAARRGARPSDEIQAGRARRSCRSSCGTCSTRPAPGPSRRPGARPVGPGQGRPAAQELRRRARGARGRPAGGLWRGGGAVRPAPRPSR